MAYEGEALVEGVVILQREGRDIRENEAKNKSMLLLYFLTRGFRI